MNKGFRFPVVAILVSVLLSGVASPAHASDSFSAIRDKWFQKKGNHEFRDLFAIQKRYEENEPAVESPFADQPLVVVNPENLYAILSSGSVDLLASVNSVQKAKDSLTLARYELLPSLNLNLIMAFTSTPLFLANMASCLTPFLFPSKWYDLKAANKFYEAEVVGLHIARLNLYASAYSVVTSIAGDEEGLQVVDSQYERLEEYVRSVRIQYDLGLIPRRDLVRAELELGKLESDMSKMIQLIEEERAILRKMLGLRLDQEIELAALPETSSRIEDDVEFASLAEIQANAPEAKQLAFAKEAAKAALRSSQWAFLGGCSGSQGAIDTSGSALMNFSTGANLQFGMSYFPKVKLSKRAIADIEIRQKELEFELARVLESAVSSVQQVKKRVRISAKNLEYAEALLNEQIRLLELGNGSVRDVLDSFNAVSNAKAEKFNTSLELEGHRLTLRRLVLEGEFESILKSSEKEFEKKSRKQKREEKKNNKKKKDS